MIYTTSISKIKNIKDIIRESKSFLITRSDLSYSEDMIDLGIEHNPTLAPSWTLSNESQNYTGNHFGLFHKKVYVPLFTAEMKRVDAINELKRLVSILNNGQDIVLICHCSDDLCHKRLVANILAKVVNQKVVNL